MILQRLRQRWHRKTYRSIVGVLIIAFALFAQYRLTNVPVPVEVENVAGFSPVVINPQQQELVIEEPVTDARASGQWLITHRGEINQFPDVYFDQAKLSDQTLLLLGNLGLVPPVDFTKISFTARAISSGRNPTGECRCFFEIKPEHENELPHTIRFFQPEAPSSPGDDRFPGFEMIAEGASLTLRLGVDIANSDNLQLDSCGYTYLLKVGDSFEQGINGTIPISIAAAAGSSFRLFFQTNRNSQGHGADDLFYPFTFAEDPPLFFARALKVRSYPTPGATPPTPNLQATGISSRLRIFKFGIGASRLQAGVSGNGLVQRDGRRVGSSLSERIRAHPRKAGMILAGNFLFTLGLFYWLLRQKQVIEPPLPVSIPDIFLSYARENTEQAEALADALSQRGWSVWWDRSIIPGANFDQVIKEALDASKCIIALWSESSVESDWVKDEAGVGRDRDVLIPVLIEDVEIPLGFRQIQAARLTEWDGSVTAPELEMLSLAITRLIAPTIKMLDTGW
jgi:hypothetical protein